MKLFSLFLASTLLLGCATQKTEGPKQPKQEELQELNEIEIPTNASTSPEAKQKRLDYLKKLITDKNRDLSNLEELTKDKTKTPEEELKAELLTNEILLLEAYQYGIEEGLDLGEIEAP